MTSSFTALSNSSVVPMTNFNADLNRGVPLETFFEQHRISHIKKCSIDEVKSAMKSLVPNDIRTASDSTLEAIISVVHYPELLELLVNEMSVAVCSFHILENHSNPLVRCSLLSTSLVSATDHWRFVVF